MMVAGEAASSSSLGKRARRRYETYSHGLPLANDEDSEENEPGPQKRAKADAKRVPRGAESTKRARRSPTTSTGTRQKINCKSKAAGRGAGRLASTTARGVYDRSLPGHSVSQGSMGALVPGQSSWVEEREVEVQHDTGSAAPQQIVLQSAENAEDGNLHAIPKKLSTRQRLMLETTQADEERGAVREIKCKLCPSAGFSSWETFKRHCKTCEKHPAELRFCPRCGDYFARPDSGKRHRKDDELKKKCRNTRPEWAREKKQNVKRLLREFEASLGHRLRNGGDITPFSIVANKTLEDTSKKVSKRETTRSEDDSWATGLH
jgi:hypothetical protein